jgi:predicted lipid-binding transport protein (Tim44 family)
VIDLLFLALVAAFVFFRLFGVLGSRDGHDKKRTSPFSSAKKPTSRDDKASDSKSPNSKTMAGLEKIFGNWGEGNIGDVIDVAHESTEIGVKGGQTTLNKLKKKDPAFQVNVFLKGAKNAFPMILNAYAEGKLDKVKSYVHDDVLNAFSLGIQARQKAKETLEIVIQDLRAEIVNATIIHNMVQIEVEFHSEQLHKVRKGGDSFQEALACVDLWTFERALDGKNPNWILIGTQEGVHTERD